jgi:predicted nucleic-acid-binding protein
MKIIADTNVLLRATLDDDPKQSRIARLALKSAEQIAISGFTLCEFVWVLNRSYKLPKAEIIRVILRLLDSRNVIVDRPAVDAGLAALQAGADFADGAIVYEGAWLGGETFVSFDKKAVAALTRQGLKAKLLG